MLTLKEVSKILGVGTQTVTEWSDKGKIEFISIDGEYYFTRDSIDSFISETGIKLVEPTVLNVEKIMNKHYEEKNILTPEEIENLLKEEQKK
ncbi:helix-turn-helix domain-containing protein [Proteiniborus sp. MB09-C3]|uniref:helix-turn-helix domain-containing protein n=1 Tax=Proteiniborus sp. MB09-C3 TaxID=3050072 RepID=UPI002553A790|nr:helix-turn-helix domain-containing protein [Proteiniborus sp. MB09-C3]WIV13847.1 helix-turn-helix domain-containing protein [Proteiniborus sp. MB09-C3]